MMTVMMSLSLAMIMTMKTIDDNNDEMMMGDRNLARN
jgi:hypothetical protein